MPCSTKGLHRFTLPKPECKTPWPKPFRHQNTIFEKSHEYGTVSCTRAHTMYDIYLKRSGNRTDAEGHNAPLDFHFLDRSKLSKKVLVFRMFRGFRQDDSRQS